MSGPAQFTWSGTDLAGNSGSQITSGATFFMDTLGPDNVQDLRVLSASTSSIRIGWTAPADYGPASNASVYDLRYAHQPIATESDFLNASPVPSPPSPGPPGSSESASLSDPALNTDYYFALKSLDSLGNSSALSNFVSTRVPVFLPLSPSNLAGTALSASSILWTWTDRALDHCF